MLKHASSEMLMRFIMSITSAHDAGQLWYDTVYGTTNTVYGTTTADAGVGIGMKRGDSKI